MRFAVNVAMMFTELPFLDRIPAAAEAGFDAVEFWWPSEHEREQVADVAAAAGVQVIRFALDPGRDHGGLLCDPARVHEFRSTARQGLALAGSLGCGMVNAMVGTQLASAERGKQLSCGRDNLAWLAEHASAHGIEVLVEANCQAEKPGYLIDTTTEARAFIEDVGHPSVGLLYDVYHMYRSGEDVVASFTTHLAQIRHVQIADAPDRHEPGTGEIDFGAVLSQYHDLGYRGYIGLEYRPLTTTLAGLSWLPRELRAGPLCREQLASLGG